MAYYSNGAFNFEQVYDMPIYLRNFYFKQLEDAKKKEQELMKQGSQKPRKR